jgi:hypothetical protein
MGGRGLSMTRPRVTPNLLAFAEWSLTTLRKLGNAQRIDHAVALSE